jgi:hypothetical protein
MLPPLNIKINSVKPPDNPLSLNKRIRTTKFEIHSCKHCANSHNNKLLIHFHLLHYQNNWKTILKCKQSYSSEQHLEKTWYIEKMKYNLRNGN